jgi:hypothetical protein
VDLPGSSRIAYARGGHQRHALRGVSGLFSELGRPPTLAVHAMTIDRGAADHDIVDNGKAALASDPVALAVLYTAIRQDGSLIESHSSTVQLFRYGDLVGVKEVPAGAIDHLIWSVAKDVDNRIRRVEDMCILSKVYQSQLQATGCRG